jgi:hypothetical protein
MRRSMPPWTNEESSRATLLGQATSWLLLDQLVLRLVDLRILVSGGCHAGCKTSGTTGGRLISNAQKEWPHTESAE